MSDLIFKTISISNFKTFVGDHVIELNRPGQLVYITGANKVHPELGANGVGKSTIWDALTWVLWGRTGRDNRPADAVKPWKGTKGSVAVGVHFTRSDGTHTLLRTRNPNSLRYWPAMGDHPGKEITQDEVPKLLGMTEEMFRRTLVLGQFGTLFLDLKPEAQAQMFTEALGLDLWLRAIDVASEQARGCQRMADQAVADMATNEALLADIAVQIEDQQAKADVFDKDKAERLRKWQKGIDQLEADLEEAQEAVPEKPKVPAAMEDFSELRAAAAADLTIAERTLSSLEDTSKHISQELAKLETDAGQRCGTCKQKLTAAALTTTRDTLKAQAQETFAKRKAKQKEIDTLFAKVNSLISQQQAARTVYDTARKNYQPKLGKYEAAVRKIASIQGELKRWREQLANVEAETNQAAAEVDKLTKRRRLMRSTGTSLKEKHEAALAAVEEAKFWQDGFREIRLSIIDNTLVELEMATSRHAAMLGLTDWGVKFDTSRETKSGTVSYAFSVLLYPPDKKEPVKWESYSGGESQRWQIATAAALSEVLLTRAGITPNIEVWDEPSRGLSPQGIRDMLEHFKDRAIELGRAVYVVEHHSLDKGLFDGTLVVTKTRKGSSFAWQ